MSDFVIRKMDVSDIRFVDTMERDIFGKSLSEQTLSHELLYNKLAHYFTAVINQERIGYVGIWITEPNAEITNILVIEAYRKRGIGKALLEMVIQLCETHRVKDLTLEVRVSNEDAIRFYKNHGFKIASTRKNYYDNGESAYLMVRSVGGESM